jgi:tagatose-1,6-bisphosphate aldolase non-catalytic subunit AgaZ/GatZ
MRATKKVKSPIEQIHELGRIAIIDIDRQVIIKSIKPSDKENAIVLLEATYNQVGYSGGDICVSNDDDNE